MIPKPTLHPEPIRESDLHRKVVEYIRWKYPRVIFVTDLSGVRLSKGVAGKIKDLKSSRGIPDILILEPKPWRAKSGLFIELKTAKNSPFKKDGSLRADKSGHLQEQHDMIERLLDKGYQACFCIGYDHTITTIDQYLSQP